MENLLNVPISAGHTVADALVATFVLLIGGLVANVAFQRAMGAVLLRSRIPTTAHETVRVLRRGIVGLIWIVLILLILQTWGVSGSGLWTFLVSIATLVGIGFLATWSMVSNVMGSLFLTIWRPFYIGDDVEVLPENFKGRVVERNLMFTTLEQDDGQRLQVPNNFFFQKVFRVEVTHRQYGFDFAQLVPRTLRPKSRSDERVDS
jgi:small-conductance mechanosensitive channel